MRIQVCSDLHIRPGDTEEVIGQTDADVLVIAGDVLTGDPLGYLFEFLRKLGSRFEQIILVPGNHEYYTRYISETEQRLSECDLPNVTVLQEQSMVLNGVKFIGCTLWTGVTNSAVAELRDYEYIYRDDGLTITRSDTLRIHNEHLEFIIEELDRSEEPCVVISHHAPSWESIDEDFRRHPMARGYATEGLLESLESPPHIWIHGHIHSSKRYFVGDCEVICNPRGYEKADKTTENDEWNDSLVIEL